MDAKLACSVKLSAALQTTLWLVIMADGSGIRLASTQQV